MTDQPQTALRLGQFWRTEDGCEALVVEFIGDDFVDGYGALHGDIGTARVSENEFRRMFPVLVFDPVPIDERGRPPTVERLRPREPTTAMLAAGNGCETAQRRCTWTSPAQLAEIWRAMWDAADDEVAR